MIGNLLEQQIIHVFNRDLTRIYSINAISKELGKSYPHINQKVNSFIEAGVLKSITLGKSHICRIDLESDLAITYLSFDEISNREKKEKKIPKELKEISKLILDSKKAKNVVYSGNKLYVIAEENAKPFFSRYQNKIIIVTEDGFKKILLDDPSIIKDHLVMQSYEHYFKLLREIQGQMISLSLK